MTANGASSKTGSGLLVPDTASLATLALDGLCVAGFLLLRPQLTQGFASKNDIWGLLIIIGYLVLCISTWMLMRLKPQAVDKPKPMPKPKAKDDEDNGGGIMAFFALCFGIMVTVMLIELSGALEEGGILDQFSNNDLAESGMAIVMIVLPLIYLFVVVLKPKTVVEIGTAGHFVQRLVATAGINLMFIITLAYWDSSFADNEPMGLGLGGRIFVFLVVYVVMLMFLAPPRLILHSIGGSKIGLASFCFWLAVYTWNLTV